MVRRELPDHRRFRGEGTFGMTEDTNEAIVPDDKDWTWVLDRPCPECGFVAAEIDSAHMATLVRAFTAPWPDLLISPGFGSHLDVRTRPEPGVWSALEYGCHVRDVCRVFTGRVMLLLEHDDPTFENWDQDAAATSGHYNEQDPAVVAGEILAGAAALADSLVSVPHTGWDREGIRSNGSRFSVLTLGRYCLHDLRHHLHDVGHTPV
jgi:DinB superfamily